MSLDYGRAADDPPRSTAFRHLGSRRRFMRLVVFRTVEGDRNRLLADRWFEAALPSPFIDLHLPRYLTDTRARRGVPRRRGKCARVPSRDEHYRGHLNWLLR